MLPPGYDSTTRRRRRRRRPKQDDAGSLLSTSEESAAKQQQQQPDWFWDWVGEPFVQVRGRILVVPARRGLGLTGPRCCWDVATDRRRPAVDADLELVDASKEAAETADL